MSSDNYNCIRKIPGEDQWIITDESASAEWWPSTSSLIGGIRKYHSYASLGEAMLAASEMYAEYGTTIWTEENEDEVLWLETFKEDDRYYAFTSDQNFRGGVAGLLLLGVSPEALNRRIMKIKENLDRESK